MTQHPIRTHIAAYGFFLALAILITWPLLTVLSTSFAGYPFGDAHEMTRHIWWFKYALQHGQPLIFQPLLGYPDGIQGVILWSDPLQFFPGWLFAFVMPLPAAYNLQCLLNLALNGWAAYFLMWKLFESSRNQSYVKHTEKFTEFHSILGLSPSPRFPALTGAGMAGVVFMTAPVMQGHLAGGHGGLLVQWPLPLLAWALFNLRTRVDVGTRYVVSTSENNPKRISRFPLSTQHLALSTLFFVLLPFGHTLQLIYAGMPLVGVFGLTLLVKRDWRALARLILVVILGSVILLLFLIPVFQSTLGTSAYTDEGGSVDFSMDLLGIVTPSFNHPLFGQLDYTHRALGVNIVEGSSYVGIIAGLLALVAPWKNRAARWWLLLAAVAWVLALGPLLKIFDTPIALRNGEYSTFVTLPWSLVADLPGFNLARTPGRFGFVMALAVAVMAGYGAAWISSQFPVSSRQSSNENNFRGSIIRRYLKLSPQSSTLNPVLVVLTVLILLDYQSFWPLPTYSAEIPQAVHDLARRDDVRAVFDVPWENVLAAKDALWLQTAHAKPLIAGQVTRKTPVSPAKLTILEQTFDPALLKDAGADVVIVHKQYDADGRLAAAAREKLGDPFYEDEQLALFNVPEPSQAAQLTVVMPGGRTLTGELTLDTEILQNGTDEAAAYLYAPKTGWLDVGFTVGTPVQSGTVMLDGQPLYIRRISPFADNLSLPIAQPGYHTVTAAIEPACPVYHNPAQACGFQNYSALSVSKFTPLEFDQPILFDQGVTLVAVNMERPQETTLWPMLWWRFVQPISDRAVRFLKVFDADGNPVAEGVDQPLGAQTAGSQLIDPLTILLNDLPSGTYKVCVGWYSYPDLTRFAVLSDVDGAQDGLACIGEFTVPAS